MDYDSCQRLLWNSTDCSYITRNKNLFDYENFNSSNFDATKFGNMTTLCITLKNIAKSVENEENIKFPYNYTGSTEVWKDLEIPDYFKLFAYVIVFLGGFLGNISVILTVAFNKFLWKTIHFYVANLAMADAMICLFCMIPHALSVTTSKIYILGKVMCKLNPFAEMTCLISSVLTLAAISWNRRFGVLSPLEKKAANQNTSLMVTFIWIISIAVSIPLLIVNRLVVIEFLNFNDIKCARKWPIYWYIDKNINECVSEQTLRSTYYIVVLTTLYFLPVVIMSISYSSIVWRLRQKSFAGRGNKTYHNNHSRRWKKATKRIAFLIFAFVICWTPVQVIVMYSVFIPDDHDAKPAEIPNWIINITWASKFLAYSNSFINPIIYGGFNKAFRKGFCNVLRCRCRKARLPVPGDSRPTFITRLTSSLSRRLSRLQSGSNTTNKNTNISMKVLHGSAKEKFHPLAENARASKDV